MTGSEDTKDTQEPGLGGPGSDEAIYVVEGRGHARKVTPKELEEVVSKRAQDGWQVTRMFAEERRGEDEPPRRGHLFDFQDPKEPRDAHDGAPERPPRSS